LLKIQPCKMCGADVSVDIDCTGLPICPICVCFRASSQEAELGYWEMQSRCMKSVKNDVGATKARKKAESVKKKLEEMEAPDE